ncbi:MAG: outer membrane beta-barrel domain-containing protein [Pseudomonadota bacterium]
MNKVNFLKNGVLSLTGLMLSGCSLLSFDGASEPPPPPEREQDTEEAIFEPEVARQTFKEDEIDTENLEIGLRYGILSIEDFEVNEIVAAQVNYHFIEDLFLSLNYGQATAGQSSYERLSGAAQLLTEDERDYRFYNASVGFDLFPGEVFFGSDYAYNSALYVTLGAGSTDFAGDEQFTLNFGFGFRFVATDWLTLQVLMQNYVFDSTVFGEEKTTNNFELTGGISVFF